MTLAQLHAGLKIGYNIHWHTSLGAAGISSFSFFSLLSSLSSFLSLCFLLCEDLSFVFSSWSLREDLWCFSPCLPENMSQWSLHVYIYLSPKIRIFIFVVISFHNIILIIFCVQNLQHKGRLLCFHNVSLSADHSQFILYDWTSSTFKARSHRAKVKKIKEQLEEIKEKNTNIKEIFRSSSVWIGGQNCIYF